jgi:hypothetical protein
VIVDIGNPKPLKRGGTEEAEDGPSQTIQSQKPGWATGLLCKSNGGFGDPGFPPQQAKKRSCWAPEFVRDPTEAAVPQNLFSGSGAGLSLAQKQRFGEQDINVARGFEMAVPVS